MSVRVLRPETRVLTLGQGVTVRGALATEPTNGLLNNLIAYWPGNEANGDALDAHTNALHLTDVNTVTSAAGLVYATARQYTAVNSEYHRRPGDDALLSTGDVDFTIAAWVFLDSKGANRVIAAKDVSPQREWLLRFNNASNRFEFALTGITNLLANSLGVPALAVWYFITAWHDSVANTISIQINNGGIDSVGTAPPVDSTAPFEIGAYSLSTNHWNGRIGPTMFWKSAGGGGAVLTAAQRTALYAAGAGLPYTSFTT